MNIRNWFRRFSSDDEDDEQDRARKLIDSLPKMRQQHYLFAHRFLPAALHQMGAISVLLLGDPDNSAPFLHEVWDDCGQGLEGRDLVAPDSLKSTVARANGKLLAIITMPTPEAVPEAHFAAVLSDIPPEIGEDDVEALESSDTREVLRLMLRSMPIRYFTLEKGVSMDGRPRTVFCEWTSEGSHANMGDGPEPTARAFFHFVASQNFSLGPDES